MLYIGGPSPLELAIDTVHILAVCKVNGSPCQADFVTGPGKARELHRRHFWSMVNCTLLSTGSNLSFQIGAVVWSEVDDLKVICYIYRGGRSEREDEGES